LSNGETLAFIWYDSNKQGYVVANDLTDTAPAVTITGTKAVNADRWTNKAATVYDGWNPKTRKQKSSTIPSGTKVQARDKLTLSNGEIVVCIWTSSTAWNGGYINANDLTDTAPVTVTNTANTNPGASTIGTSNTTSEPSFVAVPESEKMPKEGGGFLCNIQQSSLQSGLVQGLYDCTATLCLYVPYDGINFFMTNRTWENFLIEQGINFTKDHVTDAQFNQLLSILARKCASAAAVIGIAKDLYDIGEKVETIANFIRDVRNDSRLKQINSNEYALINVYLKKLHSGAYYTGKYEVQTCMYNNNMKPEKPETCAKCSNCKTFRPMSEINELCQGIKLNGTGTVQTQSYSSSSASQQPQTFSTSNYTRFGSASLSNISGSNYIGNINSTSGFKFTVNSNTAATVKFNIKYRSDARGGKLKVNGTAQNISFPSTDWQWGTKEVKVQLIKGANTIEFCGGYQTAYAPDIAEITVTW